MKRKLCVQNKIKQYNVVYYAREYVKIFTNSIYYRSKNKHNVLHFKQNKIYILQVSKSAFIANPITFAQLQNFQFFNQEYAVLPQQGQLHFKSNYISVVAKLPVFYLETYGSSPAGVISLRIHLHLRSCQTSGFLPRNHRLFLLY